MKKLWFLALFLVLPLLMGFTVQKDKGKIGSIYQCTVDADVDSSFSTTVDADSAAAQKTLNITATTNLAADDVLIVNPGGAREEICVVDTVSAGASVDCDDNLVYTHTAVQGDTVRLTNRVGPLNSGGIYHLQLTSSADAAQAGLILQGTELVDIDNTEEMGIAVGTIPDGFTVKIPSNRLYIGVRSQADNAVFRACQVN